jgi:nucleotide-binding universal stress UspA family protein
VELAWRLADPTVQALEVVHAYHVLPERMFRDVGFTAQVLLEYQREAKQRAQAAVEEFLAGVEAAPPARIVLREGDARQAILDAAAQHDPDLLALGTHGRSGLAHVLLGSVAEAVIRAASCDVLVARAVGLPFKLP